jgi:hypothetical protein
MDELKAAAEALTALYDKVQEGKVKAAQIEEYVHNGLYLTVSDLRRLTEYLRGRENDFIITVIEDKKIPVEYKTESLRAVMILKDMMDKSGIACFVYDREGKRIPDSVFEKLFYYTEVFKKEKA